jgi:hypothetical protein
MTIYCINSAVTPIQILLLTKWKIAETHTNSLCDQFRSCKEIAQNCFISPFLTPIHSDFDSTANNSSKLASMSKAEMIKDIETGDIVRHLDSNGTTAHDDD